MPWTEITRPHYDRRGQRYASDCSDEEWALAAPFMPPVSKAGHLRILWQNNVLQAQNTARMPFGSGYARLLRCRKDLCEIAEVLGGCG